MTRRLQELRVYQIESAYRGKANHCCCGCAGTYYRDVVRIQRVLDVLVANQEAVHPYGGSCLSADIGNRTYSLYLRSPEATDYASN